MSECVSITEKCGMYKVKVPTDYAPPPKCIKKNMQYPVDEYVK